MCRQHRAALTGGVASRRRVRLLAVASLATGLIAAGCGGDDDAGESLSDEEPVARVNALGKEEFIAKANEICEQGNADLARARQERLGQGRAPAQDRDAFAAETMVPNVQGQIDDIRALGIPDSDEDTVKGFLDETEVILDQLERDSASFSSDPFAQVREDFAAYGLTACGPIVGG